MAEAKKLIKQGKNIQFLTKYWMSHAGVLPQSADRMLIFLKIIPNFQKLFL